MTRPFLTHDGFLIPNAGDVTNPRMAEPDRIDFNTIAHAQWGVIEGCLVTVSGLTALLQPGLAIVNGILATVPNQSVTLGSGGAQDRFDLIAVDQAGTIKVISGAPSLDPVFPDPPLNVTVLAVVFAPSGVSTLVDNVIDKRKFIAKSLLTKIPAGDMLVQNKNEVGNHFTLTGGGTLGWEGDTELWRSDIATLRVKSKLLVDDTISTGNVQASGYVSALGNISGNNLQFSSGAEPLLPPNGAVWQRGDTGRVFVRQSGAWKELATVEGVIPAGTVINSVEPPSVMIPLGWLPLDGRTISEANYGKLFTLTALQGFITAGTPRTMALPDLTNRVPLTSQAAPLVFGGANSVSLSPANIPAHKHNVRISPNSGSVQGTVGRAGGHVHGVLGGEHDHTIPNVEHKHLGMENPAGGWCAVISTVFGGQNKIDALFNDRNHTYSVEAMGWTSPASHGLDRTTSAGSAHGHVLGEDGDHDHTINISTTSHDHALTEDSVGSAQAFTTTPAHFTTYTYIRS